jgi:hypothetical protein
MAEGRQGAAGDDATGCGVTRRDTASETVARIALRGWARIFE